MPRNPVAKNMNRVHRPTTIPNKKADNAPAVCTHCFGTGEIVVYYYDSGYPEECPECGGTGEVDG